MTRDILLKKVCPITRIYDCKKNIVVMIVNE